MMKSVVLFVALLEPMAWSQVKTGTIIVLIFGKDEITISADSRVNFPNGGQDDTECKLSSFGDIFAFAMAGIASRNDSTAKWDTQLIARKIWESESRHESDAAKLVRSVSDRWTAETRKLYTDPLIIRYRRDSESSNLANATFAATDKGGKLVLTLIDVSFDKALFDAKGEIHLKYSSHELIPGDWATGGLGEIAREFMAPSSTRATEYMNWWLPQISRLDSSGRGIAVATKLIELSILLHPNRQVLGFPVDGLQIRPRTGIRWFANEKKCPEK
jgi:hypothetical protein